jgi:anti-sigma regulatory factor (Ser/Thr protein kinase)
MGVREKLGLREGGFGLLITNGMVDEMRHNETGNEVTLIKRFRPDGTDAR